MSNPTELPDLPKPFGIIDIYDDAGSYMGCRDGFTADQMRGYLLDYAVKIGLAQPEGEAPQADLTRRQKENAEFSEWWAGSGQQATHDLITENAAHATWQERARRAATLSPLCGAQHAESGKDADAAEKAAAYDELNRIAELHGFASAAAAIAAARRVPQQATPAPRIIGGQPWSKEAEMTEGWLAAQQAAAPGAVKAFPALTSAQRHADELLVMLQRVRKVDERADYRTDLTDAVAALLDKVAAASAPGTPEAPIVAAVRALANKWQAEAVADGFATHEGAIELDELLAAQLDGGQEGSESNG